MITGYMESSLGNSEVFKGINEQNPDRKLSDTAINLIKTAKHLEISDIEAAYISLKQISESLTVAALKAYENGDTVLIFNDNPKLSMSQTLPFITFKRQEKFITYVFMDRFISIGRDGRYNLQSTNLRDLLTGAVIANGLKRNYGLLASNQYLAKTLMSIYTDFLCRIINKNYSIAVDKVLFDSLQYYINRFFLENIFDMVENENNVIAVASKHFRYIDEMQADALNHNYESINPKKLSELIQLISTLSPRLKSINMSSILTSWINYYFIPSMLAIDNIEYLIFMIICLLNGNNIININASDIVKETKGIKDFRGEILKLI